MTLTNNFKYQSLGNLQMAEAMLANVLTSEIKSDFVQYYIIKHAARSKNFSEAVNFILKSKAIDTAGFLLDQVIENLKLAKKVLDPLSNDGAIRTESDCWGFLDLEDPALNGMNKLFSDLVNKLIDAENNPNREIDTEHFNLGIVKICFDEDSDSHLFAIQRTSDVGHKVISESKPSFIRKNNEAFIVQDDRYRIRSEYDFFLFVIDGKKSLYISNFSHFEVTTNFVEVQNEKVKSGLSILVDDHLITKAVQQKMTSHVDKMGVREKTHFIRAINSGNHKKWNSLKAQQDKANASLPDEKKWKMKFDNNDNFVYDGTHDSVMQIVKFISHTIVKSASDESVIIDISRWTPSS